ncbi:hypothetical protein MD484_g3721, partial [Candolleomyces efflorescens]
MQFKFTLVALAGVLASVTTQALAAEVLTAPRVYHTVIKQSPYLVERTTTVTWTIAQRRFKENPSLAETDAVRLILRSLGRKPWEAREPNFAIPGYISLSWKQIPIR